MNDSREPKLGVVEGDRDDWLRTIGIHGTNEELAAALRVLKRRAPLVVVPTNEASPSEGS